MLMPLKTQNNMFLLSPLQRCLHRWINSGFFFQILCCSTSSNHWAKSSFLIATLQLLLQKQTSMQNIYAKGLQPLSLKINTAPQVGGAYVHT